MGARGPQPDHKLSVVEPKIVERPKPFSGMSGAAKTVWSRIVSDLPADFYSAHELDQLRAYCEAAGLNARAASELIKRPRKKKDDEDAVEGTGPVIFVKTQNGMVPRKNPWFEIHKETSIEMATLGTKLRLNKNSKLTNKAASKLDTGRQESSRAGLKFGGRE